MVLISLPLAPGFVVDLAMVDYLGDNGAQLAENFANRYVLLALTIGVV